MKLKKILCVAACAALAFPFTACGDERGTVVHVFMPDGAPAIALAALMDSGYAGTDFTVVPSTTIAAKVSSGDADMAIMPINAAATLYNSGVGIKMLSVNTHGNLFFVGNEGDIDIDDLVGKRLGVIGQGNVPDLTLRMLLGRKGIAMEVSEDAVSGKIAVRYADDGPTLLPLLKQGKIDYALLAEPAATTAVNNLGKSIVMDMQELWMTTFDTYYPQACLVAKNSLIEKSDYVDKFLEKLATTDDWAQANPDKALAAINSHMQKGIEPTLAALNAGIVERCNIRTVAAADAKNECVTYFTMLTQLTVGELNAPALAKLPDDDFYYRT